MNDNQKQLCRDWATAPNRKWQTLNRGEWKYIFHEKTLVRYVEEASMDESIVPLLLGWLVSDDCTSYLQQYGQTVGSGWTPIRAWYEVSNKSVGNVRAVRLYHALTTEPQNATETHVIEDGCAYKVTWENYWRQESAPTVRTSTSGVSYRVANLQRDPETGLYSYTIEKRERVRQDIAEYLAATNVFQSTKEESHMGVRGADSAGGKQASVGNGRAVERRVTKNADCTHDVHNTIREDKAVEGASETVTETATGTRTVVENRNMAAKASTAGLKPGESVANEKTATGLWNQRIAKLTRDALVWIGERCRKSVFAHTHSKTTNSVEKPAFDHVSEAGGGKVYEASARRTDDGYAIDESEVEEKPVAGAVVEFRKGLYGTVRTVTDRSQAQPLDGNGMVIGESRSTRKTEGGLNDNTVSKPTNEAAGKIAKGASETVFAGETSETENVAAGGTLPSTGTVSAGGGKTLSTEVRLNENGSANVTTRERTEKRVSGASVEVQKTLRGTRRTVTDRGQSSPIDESGLVVGESRSSRMTEGGLYDNTKSVPTNEAVGMIAKSETATAFETVESATENVAAGGVLPERSAEGGSNGETKTVEVRLDENGSADVTTRTRKEKGVSDAGERISVGLDGTTNRKISKSMSGKAPEPTDIGESVESRKTEGGLWDWVVTKLKKGASTDLGGSERKTVFATRKTTSKVQSNDPGESGKTAGSGKVVERSVSRTSTGAYRVEEGETVEMAKTKADVEVRKTLRGTVKTTTDRNQSSPVGESGLVIGESRSSRMTEGGLYDNTKSVPTNSAAGTVGASVSEDKFRSREAITENKGGVQTILTPSFSQGKIVRKRANVTEMGSTDITTETDTAKEFDSGWLTWNSQRRTVNGKYTYKNGVRVYRNCKTLPLLNSVLHDMDVSIAINEYGLYDIRMSYSDLDEYKEFSGSGHAYGGWQEGTMTVTDSTGTSWNIQVRAYYGGGNEGSEAEARANAILLPGVALGNRTYITRKIKVTTQQGGGSGS